MSCGSSMSPRGRSASRPTRGRCSAAPRSACRRRSVRAASAVARAARGSAVGYATDTAVELASFALSGRLFTAELRAGTARELRVPGPVIDPRPSPDGRLVAYVRGGALRVVGTSGGRRPGARGAGVRCGLGTSPMDWPSWSGRGDGAFARFLVVSGRGPAAGRAGRRRARAALVDFRSRTTGTRSATGRLPGRRNGQCRHKALRGGPRRGAGTEVVWDRARYRVPGACALVSGRRATDSGAGAGPAQSAVLAVDPDTGATRMVHADEDRQWLDLFPACRAGARRDSSSGSPTRAGRGSWPSVNARSRDRRWSARGAGRLGRRRPDRGVGR